MTSNTEGHKLDLSQFRYHVYVNDELVLLTKTRLGIRGFLQEFSENEEFRGFTVTVHDIHQDPPMDRAAGAVGKTAKIIPFYR